MLDNDSNAAAYGELLVGAGRGARTLFYIGIGTGIGAGLVVDGRIWRGANGYAGEFGHMTIDPDGIECACGNVGCLEARFLGAEHRAPCPRAPLPRPHVVALALRHRATASSRARTSPTRPAANDDMAR